jgi:hypothetical protein
MAVSTAHTRDSKAIIFPPSVPFGKTPKASDRSTGPGVHMTTNKGTSNAHMKVLGTTNCTQPAAMEAFKFPRESKAILPLPSVSPGKAPKEDDRFTGLSVHMGTSEDKSIALMNTSIVGAAKCTQRAVVSNAALTLPSVSLGKTPKEDVRSTGPCVRMGTS